MLLLSAAAAFAPDARAGAVRRASVAVSTASPAALGREALSVLAVRAEDSDPEVRALVAASWGDLGNRAAISYLKRALVDDNPDVRIAAAASLLRLGDVQGLVALIDETKPIRSGPSASPAEELRRMARDAARARATIRLGETGRDSALAALKTSLADHAGEVRDAAAIALARQGKADAVQFVEALKNPDEGVRASAARALGLIGRDGLAELKKVLSSDAAASVRAEAAAALGSFSDPPSAALLAEALSDKSGRVRLAAVKALSRRDEPASTAALKRLLDQAPPPELALPAESALADRGEDVDLSLPELTLGQRDPELKVAAVTVLAASRRPEAQDLLAKAMREDPEPLVRAKAAAALVARLRRVEGGR